MTHHPVLKIAALVPILDEDIVDFGVGTPEDQAAAARRIAERQAEATARWRALPLRIRAWRRFRLLRGRIRDSLADALLAASRRIR